MICIILYKYLYNIALTNHNTNNHINAVLHQAAHHDVFHSGVFSRICSGASLQAPVHVQRGRQFTPVRHRVPAKDGGPRMARGNYHCNSLVFARAGGVHAQHARHISTSLIARPLSHVPLFRGLVHCGGFGRAGYHRWELAVGLFDDLLIHNARRVFHDKHGGQVRHQV